MLKTTMRLRATTKKCRQHSRSLSTPRPFQIDTLDHGLENVPIEEFRERAFLAEKPILITRGSLCTQLASLPAQKKWFETHSGLREDYMHAVPAHQYLSQYADTILPYELTFDLTYEPLPKIRDHQDEMGQVLAALSQSSPGSTFHRFHAPLSLFLQAYRSPMPMKQLYIAQAQIADLPKQMQEDLPVPRIVRESGKGDIYDANIWMGSPPTYTPLHKDPNPNLFVQLAGWKFIRLLEPNVGSRVFRDVQEQIGQQASSNFRGNEMMEGPERSALDDAVWGENTKAQPFEVTVSPGEALFIPKGWWHSIKSKDHGVTASVNWWFR